MSKVMFNVPNMLCYFRVAVIPVMLLLFFFDNAFTAWVNLFLFALAGLSDYLDGEIARATGQTSLLGKFLDSSTDKMIVAAVLIMLVGFHRLEGIWIVPVIVIILREILIAGVREFMALYDVIVPISRLGKWKLAFQMLSMSFLIVGTYGNALIPHAFGIGKLLFLGATAMTVISGWDYMKAGIMTMQKLDEKEAP
jgi:cardiolipin synthase